MQDRGYKGRRRTVEDVKSQGLVQTKELQMTIKYILVALRISFPMVLKSPQSESRFESYGQNSFRPSSEDLSTACDQY